MTNTNLITKLIQIARVPAHVKGYYFIRRAIELVVGDSNYLQNMTKMLYPDLAREFGTTASRVERSIRHGIFLSYQHDGLRNFNTYIGVDLFDTHGKPTNGEFIGTIADKVTNAEPEELAITAVAAHTDAADIVLNMQEGRLFSIVSVACPAYNTMCRYLTGCRCTKVNPQLVGIQNRIVCNDMDVEGNEHANLSPAASSGQEFLEKHLHIPDVPVQKHDLFDLFKTESVPHVLKQSHPDDRVTAMAEATFIYQVGEAGKD